MVKKHNIFMKRAIKLAKNGLGSVSPNPMVGAVVVHDGMIIGEGFHRKYGEAHAEVNAIASVADKELLKDSTIYVTLEPCCHYGKTPPCAKLIIDSRIPRVVVGSRDPSDKVSGKGIAMLREAGIEVIEGVMEEECRAINPAFMTAHSLHRPYIMLKWAQSSDGYIASTDGAPVKFSTPLTSVLMHRKRALFDGIMIGANTLRNDNPRLDTRLWHGKSPRPVIITRSGNLPSDSYLLSESPLSHIILDGNKPMAQNLAALVDNGITSLLVEGGAELLQSLIDEGLWDEARVETSPAVLHDGIKAPSIGGVPEKTFTIDNNCLYYYRHTRPVGVKKV